MSHHVPLPSSSLSPSEKEHLIKADLIHHLSPYYEFHAHSFFQSLQHRLFHSHPEPLINTENYQSPAITSFSSSQKLKRTVFALKKIKEFNHHFFNDEETRILNPVPPGFLAYATLYSSVGVSAAVLTWAWRTWTFNYKLAILAGGLVVANNAIVRVPNWMNEMVQNIRRKKLAKKYLKIYGEEFFHDIVNPQYDLEKLKEMENGIKKD